MIKDFLKEYENVLNKINENSIYKMSSAYGYAEDYLYKDSQMMFRQLYKKADSNMYIMKEKQHCGRI